MCGPSMHPQNGLDVLNMTLEKHPCWFYTTYRTRAIWAAPRSTNHAPSHVVTPSTVVATWDQIPVVV